MGKAKKRAAREDTSALWDAGAQEFLYTSKECVFRHIERGNARPETDYGFTPLPNFCELLTEIIVEFLVKTNNEKFA